MKTQKLIRKYRLVKPHERIQYGDWMNTCKFPPIHLLQNETENDTFRFISIFVDGEKTSTTTSNTKMLGTEMFLGTKLKNLSPVWKVYRFVDCVPAPQKKH